MLYNNSSYRLEWLDFLKGCAILIVVLGHISQSLDSSHSFVHCIIIIEMPLFFMLSGILADKTLKRPFTINFKKKCKSLLIPFVVFGLLYSCTFNSFTQFIYSQYHNGYWFFISLFTCWLFFLPLTKISEKIRLSYFSWIIELIILLIPFILYKIIGNQISTKWNELLSLNFSLTYYRFFILGYYIGKFRNKIKVNEYISAGLTIMFFFFYFNNLNYSLLTEKIPVTINQLGMTISTTYVAYFFYNISPIIIKNTISKIGFYSINIYVSHFFLLKFIDISFLNSLSELFIIILAIFISVFISGLCIFLTLPIEKNRFLKKVMLGR